MSSYNSFSNSGQDSQTRSKNLKSARVALVVACLLLGISSFVNYLTAEHQIDEEIRKELKKEGGNVFLDNETIQEAKAGMLRAFKIILIGMVSLSVIFLIFALMVYRYPLFCTIGGLILYLGFNLIMAFLIASEDGGSAMAFLFSGILWKIIILSGLIKGIHSAIAYQREVTASQSHNESLPQSDI